MIEIKSTPRFIRLAKKSMTSESLQALIDTLALEPEKGDLVIGTGELEKSVGLQVRVEGSEEAYVYFIIMME